MIIFVPIRCNRDQAAELNVAILLGGLEARL